MNDLLDSRLLQHIRQARVITLAHKAMITGTAEDRSQYVDEIGQCDIILALLEIIDAEVAGGGVGSTDVGVVEYPF